MFDWGRKPTPHTHIFTREETQGTYQGAFGTWVRSVCSCGVQMGDASFIPDSLLTVDDSSGGELTELDIRLCTCSALNGWDDPFCPYHHPS